LKGTEVTTHLVAPLKTLRPLNQQEIAMARRQPETHLWSFDPIDDTSVPNARIALALMVCVRRLPGAFPEHDFDDLGAVLGPALVEGWRPRYCQVCGSGRPTAIIRPAMRATAGVGRS
jgi:hypothetical protein